MDVEDELCKHLDCMLRDLLNQILFLYML